MKQVAGSIKGELAQYREMAAFAQFGSDLDASTQKLLARGERLTELLKQKQFSPISTNEQVVLLFAGVNGYMDDVAVSQIGNYEEGLLNHIRENYAQVLETIMATKSLDEDTEESLKVAVEEFSSNFNK